MPFLRKFPFAFTDISVSNYIDITLGIYVLLSITVIAIIATHIYSYISELYTPYKKIDSPPEKHMLPIHHRVEIVIPPSHIHHDLRVHSPKTLKRPMTRNNSAPTFTVPLSPSDEPKCVF